VKFRLSSLLLTTTVAALALGWYLDRASFDRRISELENRYLEAIDDHWGGVATLTDARRLIVLSRNYKKRDTNSPFSFDSDLVWAMMHLWRNEDEVNIAIGRDDEFAVTHGHDILDLLDCTKGDDFFSVAKKTLGRSGQDAELFPELYDCDSKEYKSLRDFVERSTTTEHVTEWGW
jgi:hypothetical protein